jgi:hypothetical protein
VAISKTAFDEPLLSKRHASVLREIARAAQLHQGLIELEKIQGSLFEQQPFTAKVNRFHELTHYIKSEIEKALRSIKVPKQSDCDQGSSKQDR